MVTKSLAKALATAVLLAIPLFTAASYPTITVSNHTTMPLMVGVMYALPLFCRGDRFYVTAGTVAVPGGAITPGTGTAREGRGVCLVTDIVAQGTSPVTPYTSSGTSYGAFVVGRFGNSYGIKARQDVP